MKAELRSTEQKNVCIGKICRVCIKNFPTLLVQKVSITLAVIFLHINNVIGSSFMYASKFKKEILLKGMDKIESSIRLIRI